MDAEHRELALSALIGRTMPSQAGSLVLWLLWPQAFSGPEIDMLAQLLSEDEAERRSRFNYARDRTLYAAAHGLLRLALSASDGRDSRVHRFVSGPHGRPELSGADPRLDLRFNISHTPGLVAVVTASGLACGVDVEDMARMVGLADRLAGDVLAPAERAALAALAEADRTKRFASLWTLKEAWLKAVGLGLTIEPSRVVIAFGEDGAPTLCGPDGGRWELRSMAAGERHRLAVAWHREKGRLGEPLKVVHVVPG